MSFVEDTTRAFKAVAENELLGEPISADVEAVEDVDSELGGDELIDEIKLHHGEDVDTPSEAGEVFVLDMWLILRRGSVNVFLPFINGLMLGFGEILAHELGFRYNWFGAKVYPPVRVAKRREAQSKFL